MDLPPSATPCVAGCFPGLWPVFPRIDRGLMTGLGSWAYCCRRELATTSIPKPALLRSVWTASLPVPTTPWIGYSATPARTRSPTGHQDDRRRVGGRQGYVVDRTASRHQETPNGTCVALCEESIMDTETGDFFLMIDV
jgi:hypothetical protein